MPPWYWKWLRISLAGALLSASGPLAVVVTLSMGLLLPVWVIFANLWWLLLVSAPWVLLARRGRPWLGGTVTAGLFAALSLWVWQGVAGARARVLPPPVVAGEGRVSDPLPLGLEISGEPGACSDDCLRMLSGPDVAWVRVIGDDLVWRRAAQAECLALDPGRDDEPCILVTRDATRAPDLRLVHTIREPGEGQPPRSGDWVDLMRWQVLTLTDAHGLRLQEQGLDVSEVIGPFLMPRLQGGLELARASTWYGRMSPVTILSRAGVKMGPIVQVDTSLILSLAEVMKGHDWPRRSGFMFWVWIWEISEGRRVPDAADRAALVALARAGYQSAEMTKLRQQHPDWFAP